MKNIITITLGVMMMAMAACTPEVDLYADYKDVPVVYGILECDADTNFVKITHTMNDQGNALVAAGKSQLSDYPGKLDVRLTEYCNGDSVRQIILDTVTVHYKQDGLFYAPAQKLYYTTEPLPKNDSESQYSYRLTIVLPDRTLNLNAWLVGDDKLRIRSATANFSGGNVSYDPASPPIYFIPAYNADIYEITMSFKYLERRTFQSDTVPHSMTWSLGVYYKSELDKTMIGDAYTVEFLRSDLFHALEEHIGNDTLVPGLRRFITDNALQVTVTAAGYNFGQYYHNYTVANSVPEGENGPSLIEGGYGVFSSKASVKRGLRLAGTTVPDVVAVSQWGFKYIGGQYPFD